MVSLLQAPDICLPTHEIRGLLVQVFLKILRGDKELETLLCLVLNANIESWRSIGCVRGMAVPICDVIGKRRALLVKENAIPQLSHAERNEMVEILVWLMAGEQNDFGASSATVYAAGEALAGAGIHLRAGGERRFRGPTFGSLRLFTEWPLWLEKHEILQRLNEQNPSSAEYISPFRT
jgi:hypothetical protein